MKQIYPIVTTLNPAECCEFYVRALGARVLFKQDWYVHLSVGGWEIGFLQANHPQRLPVFQHSSLSRGLCLALEVEDVRHLHDELQAKGIELLGGLRRYPGGDVSFSIMDPAGTVLNVVERHVEASSAFTA